MYKDFVRELLNSYNTMTFKVDFLNVQLILLLIWLILLLFSIYNNSKT